MAPLGYSPHLPSSPWLVSRRFDLSAFLGPAFLALLLLPLGPKVAPTGETPLPLWIIAVLLVDVAHVWATLYRTYFDPEEILRHRARYVVTPLAVYAAGIVFYSISDALFWTVLAYVAVIHFVRQQYGWVALYNRRDPAAQRLDRGIDAAAIYASTIYPLVWWHAHLPRRFEWFMPGDFVEDVISLPLSTALAPLYGLALAIFTLRQIVRRMREGAWRTGKMVVVYTTAACWGLGILATDSDFAFTVTNVLIHGVPYMAIVWIYGRRAHHAPGSWLAWIFHGRRIGVFYGLVAVLAYLEELGWDRMVWHERPTVFPFESLYLEDAVLVALVPLLAVPQATHYILDAFIWRTRAAENPDLARILSLSVPGGGKKSNEIAAARS